MVLDLSPRSLFYTPLCLVGLTSLFAVTRVVTKVRNSKTFELVDGEWLTNAHHEPYKSFLY